MSATLSSNQRKFSDAYFEGNTTGVSPLRQTGEGLLQDLAIGVIGGGLASAVLGRYSFVIGLGLSGYGHYSQNRLLSVLGLGMMASGTFSALTGRDQDQKKPFGEQVTERVQAFKSEFKRKLWLDYFDKKNGKTKGTTQESLGGVATFGHEEQVMNQPVEKANYFNETILEVHPENFPELTATEKSFLEKKVDSAINREMNLFLENRQAVASYLETGEVTVQKTETKKQDTTQQEVEQNFESHIQQAQSKNDNKKSPSAIKVDPYPDYEPEPQELIF